MRKHLKNLEGGVSAWREGGGALATTISEG